MTTSFFDVVGARSPRLWTPPAGTVLPRIVSVNNRIAKSSRACFAIESIACWPTGLTINAAVIVRAGERGKRSLEIVRHPAQSQESSRDGLLFGVEFSDGQIATNIDRVEHGARLTGGPSMTPGAGQAGENSYRQAVFLQPLPPPGKLSFVISWLDLGIDETVLGVDATQLLSESKDTQEIW